MYLESPVEAVRNLNVKRMPKRKLSGTYFPKHHLFITNHGTVYAEYLPRDGGMVSLRQSPLISERWAHRLLDCGLISVTAHAKHLKVLEPHLKEARRVRAASDLQYAAERLGIELTAEQKKAAGL